MTEQRTLHWLGQIDPLPVLARLGPADAVLLVADGVYALQRGGGAAVALRTARAEGLQIYAAQADIQARGVLLDASAEQWLELVDDPGMVALAVRYDVHVPWF